MTSKAPKQKRILTVFMLTMINVATMGSVKNWPANAELGFVSVFFYLLAAMIFFVPTALVSAELATGWPKVGGVFAWVKEAFGHRTGFLAAWLLWVQNVVWYPTALAFIAATIAYIFKPELAGNHLYTFSVIIVIFWATTLVNLRGMRTSGWISSLGMILGTFLPGLFIIGLGAFWYLSGEPRQIDFSSSSFFPKSSSLPQLVFFAAILTSLMGIEMSAVHAKDVQNPKRNYPKAILYSALIILALSIPGVLSIALVIPQQEISLLAGTLQAIAVFFEKYNLQLWVPVFALLIAIGTIASVSTWIVGPTKGLLAAAQAGDLPPLFRKTNENAMPTPLLIFQAIVVSFISIIFVFSPSLNQAYWMLLVLVTALYLLMYLLMFAAAIKLRYKRPDVERPYKVPGGKAGMWVVASVGIVSSILTLIISLFPPEQIPVENHARFVLVMVIGLILFTLGPSIILLFQNPKWKKG